jgi:hypothetical protein
MEYCTSLWKFVQYVRKIMKKSSNNTLIIEDVAKQIKIFAQIKFEFFA